MSEICKSSVLQAEDAIRLPSCVNNLGEYLASSSDNIREAGGNAITAFSFSSLEQYVPFYLMHAARIAAGGSKPITMNGIESLDRTGSVLYRDLKGATSFENSFWDEEAAANSERTLREKERRQGLTHEFTGPHFGRKLCSALCRQ